MASTAFEIVIAGSRDDVMLAIGYGMHRAQWHRELQLADGEDSIMDDLPVRWEAQLVDHRVSIDVKANGDSTALTYTITVPEQTNPAKLHDLAKKHEAAAKRLRVLIEAGEIAGHSLH